MHINLGTLTVLVRDIHPGEINRGREGGHTTQLS